MGRPRGRAMRRMTACAIAAWLCAATGWGQALQQASHDLTPPNAKAEARFLGVVLDAATGLPVSHARLSRPAGAGADLTVSGPDGRFAFSLSPGTHTVTVTAQGFKPLVLRLAAGDRGEPLTVRLERATLRHEEHLVVTPTREERSAADLPRTISVVDAATLAERSPRSTPEALADAAGVLLQKTNHGSGSPYLRGLVGNQVLVLVDGVRLNNSTYRYGPNQYLATIDPGTLERIEVVRGSGSVLYGSDAIGGVINLVTRQPHLSDGPLRLSGGVSGKLMSSGMERSGRIEAEAASSRIAVRGGLSLRDFGDLVAGGKLGVESPSGYGEVAGDVSALLRVGRASLLSLAYQQLRQSDVPRFDQVAQRGFSRYAFAPQVRQMFSADWRLFPTAGPVARLEANLSRQRTRERRERQARGSAMLIEEQDTVGVWGASLDVQLRPVAGWTLLAGADGTWDSIGSWRRDHDQASGRSVAKRGLYPDGASASSAAAFLTASWSRRRLHLDLGGRFSRYAVSARDAGFGDIDLAPSATVGSAAGRYELTRHVDVIASVAQAFRAPNVDDVSTLGAFDYGVEVPSPDLVPERAVTLEGGVRVRARRVAVSAVAFRTSLRDLIDRVPATYLGQPEFEGQRVYRKTNVARADVHGVEIEAEWHLVPSLRASGHLSYTHGHQPVTDQPMRRIPPLNGLLSLRWDGRSQTWLEGRVRMAAAQRRLAPGDLSDHRIPPGGTPGWRVLGVQGGRRLASRLHLSVGIENLLNEAYRVHGSGIDGYGRSAWVATRVEF